MILADCKNDNTFMSRFLCKVDGEQIPWRLTVLVVHPPFSEIASTNAESDRSWIDMAVGNRNFFLQFSRTLDTERKFWASSAGEEQVCLITCLK